MEVRIKNSNVRKIMDLFDFDVREPLTGPKVQVITEQDYIKSKSFEVLEGEIHEYFDGNNVLRKKEFLQPKEERIKTFIFDKEGREIAKKDDGIMWTNREFTEYHDNGEKKSFESIKIDFGHNPLKYGHAKVAYNEEGNTIETFRDGFFKVVELPEDAQKRIKEEQSSLSGFKPSYLRNLEMMNGRYSKDHRKVLDNTDLDKLENHYLNSPINYDDVYNGNTKISGWRSILEDFKHQYVLMKEKVYQECNTSQITSSSEMTEPEKENSENTLAP